jgi:purine-binding chemotaxis protein CheW
LGAAIEKRFGTMTEDGQDLYFVVFAIEGQRHAIDLGRVLRVLPAVEITPLPGAPEVVAGTVNVHGAVVPAVSMRARLGLPPRPIDLADHFLLVTTALGSLLLITDAVRDVVPLPPQLVKPAAAATREFIAAVVRVENGVLLIDDVDRLLTPGEAARLEAVLGGAEGATP